ncbi:MAG: hypothetical protein ACR2RB_15380, partial [Gammaproteobacteria bacterium]
MAQPEITPEERRRLLESLWNRLRDNAFGSLSERIGEFDRDRVVEEPDRVDIYSQTFSPEDFRAALAAWTEWEWGNRDLGDLPSPQLEIVVRGLAYEMA